MFDALWAKMRENGVVRNKAVYLALGIRRDGTREIPGIWIEASEGAKLWLKVFNDQRTRGVADVLIAVTDGLKGMPEALAAVFPATTLQTAGRDGGAGALIEPRNMARQESRAVALPLDPVKGGAFEIHSFDYCTE